MKTKNNLATGDDRFSIIAQRCTQEYRRRASVSIVSAQEEGSIFIYFYYPRIKYFFKYTRLTLLAQ
ncbi:MAG: hypothetical protein UT41_C0001G0283 [Candidatus Wolfebacteria bacterium GW2011_GWC2_39_22]|uniref:Uncharacterized protein n=1 Tax=Candidatus Wolfebacteria bacterium GW2011_GWC2_39_22 TaxID=1619013 RepID=A0A0G0N9A2_9BACT|nr:MAG: hypothetical protein UT41_C0001G0283 [Candidatus Wolfebacteria bacterium GW2011_GWC2_39_22]HBI25600.1 hypothetical protein [Candidatus Wolfebacteria bacterium]